VNVLEQRRQAGYIHSYRTRRAKSDAEAFERWRSSPHGQQAIRSLGFDPEVIIDMKMWRTMFIQGPTAPLVKQGAALVIDNGDGSSRREEFPGQDLPL
jgi:hypothetical protein